MTLSTERTCDTLARVKMTSDKPTDKKNAPVQCKRDADYQEDQPQGAEAKSHARHHAGDVHLVAQQCGDGDEDVEDPGDLVHRHEEKEEAAHPLVQVVVQVETSLGP